MNRPTLGFLSTWSVYQGATIDGYTYTLLQGISAAARQHECNLLLGCGISLAAGPRTGRTAWAVAEADADFIPVGPWNTDGLIVIPDDLSDSQFAYVRDLAHAGYPIVMTTAEIPGLVLNNSRLVTVDNAGGIRHALQHLFLHGHRQIAFVAGKSGHGGDSAERLAAYRETLRQANIPYDPRLVAFGEHRTRDGRIAMQQILDTGAPFTALVASNDLSGLGAIEVLRAAGRRVPEDVAVIGFDDILEARSQLSPLTTVRHPTFVLGYESVITLLDTIRARSKQPTPKNPNGNKRVLESTKRIPTQLVVRQSCGCRPENTASKISIASEGDTPKLVHEMVRATVVESRHSTVQEIEPMCFELVGAFKAALAKHDAAPFDRVLKQLSVWLDTHYEDANAWQAAVSNLRALTLRPEMEASPTIAFAHTLIDRARLEISEQAQRQATDALLQHMEMSNRLGLMTAQLLAVLDTAKGAKILAEHLPHLGIERALVATYRARDDDPYASALVLLDTGTTTQHSLVGLEFSPREFQADDFYPDAPMQLALLPLSVAQPAAPELSTAGERGTGKREQGFVALALQPHTPLTSLETCAAITHNLGAAMRSGNLYREALKGRHLAEEANRLKSRFLSTVSHELRTPLSLIVGLSDMVLEETEDAVSPTVQRDVQQIHASAQHLGRLISDVLDLASSEAGRLRLAPEPLDLTAELAEIAVIAEQMAHDKGLQWCMSFKDATGGAAGTVTVMADRTRLRQIVLNLLSNAVKFTPSGRIALDMCVAGETATIAISDTGIGISPSEQSKLFREFQRTERTIAAGYGGMGLGLAISKHLVEQHGGTIGVRSPGDFGSGSTFFLKLPRLNPSAQAAWSDHVLAHTLDTTENFKPFTADLVAAALAPDETTRTILVVDDNREVLALHCRLVEQLGYRALRASNGHEALKIVETTRPALVLLDLMMPELDGFQVLDALRTGETTRDIPVIVLTARTLDETDIERLNHGVAAIMAKGLFRSSETLQHIQAALEQQRASLSPIRRLVRRAMGFIHEKYTEPLTREQIAAHVNISADYLTDCFRQEVGITPMVYLNRYRLRHARELLKETDFKITQIALAVGFSESAHFTRMFQREVGVTPRAWRQGQRT